MRRVGAVLLAAIAVAAIVVAGLGAFGSASRAAGAPYVPRAIPHRAHAAPGHARPVPPALVSRAHALAQRLHPTRPAHAPTLRVMPRPPVGTTCFVGTAPCSLPACTQFIDHRLPLPAQRLRRLHVYRTLRARCATVGDRNLRPQLVPVSDGVLRSSTAPVATRSR